MKTLEHLVSANWEKLEEMEALLGCKFHSKILLQKALVHSSFGFEQIADGQNNETLEFLGYAFAQVS
jgi:dsRNA-specific ribonuclease